MLKVGGWGACSGSGNNSVVLGLGASLCISKKSLERFWRASDANVENCSAFATTDKPEAKPDREPGSSN
jgi:hypothetical protein